METALSLLKQNNLLKDWSDQNILPGQHISESIRKKMDETDISVFLFSPDFIDSTSCIEEWQRVKKLQVEGKLIFRVPIILRECAWQDFLGNDDLKALPQDGKPIRKYSDSDTAWQEVYEGIKALIEHMRKTFAPKTEFLETMERTEFLSEKHIKLQDIFTFLPLTYYAPTEEGSQLEKTINTKEDLLKEKLALIHGEEMSGKTALSRYLFLFLVKEEAKPTLHLDLKNIHSYPKNDPERLLRKAYYEEFSGDYLLWKQQNNKTLILDNLNPDMVDFVVQSKQIFDNIFITLSSDTFRAFFRDEMRLADFCEMEINSLTHKQQESLISKRSRLLNGHKTVPDGLIDQIENHINSIIGAKKLVPRYPFFVLTILQTYEGFMPTDLSITSYGHCYYVLIIATLKKAGVSLKDSEISTCFNFAEHLAFELYQHNKKKIDLDFEEFVKEYKKDFHITNATLNRLHNHEYGLISKTKSFSNPYMYYYFLGKFLANRRAEHKDLIKDLCDKDHIYSNYLILLFIIHHTNDTQIIDNILHNTKCIMEDVSPAKLDYAETQRFTDIVGKLPQSILSSNSTAEGRRKERDSRDRAESQLTPDDNETSVDENPVNDVYRILKGNEIMGQILRNKHGTLPKTKIKEIIMTVADSGLRLVNCLLANPEEIEKYARYIHEKYPSKHDIQEIKAWLRFYSFYWTMINVEKIVADINVPEIKESIQNIVHEKSTPAYKLIGYFYQLDSVPELTNNEKKQLNTLLNQHPDTFFKKVLSLRTQHYMNTHRGKAPIEQAICHLLGINYVPKQKTLK